MTYATERDDTTGLSVTKSMWAPVIVIMFVAAFPLFTSSEYAATATLKVGKVNIEQQTVRSYIPR